MATRHQVIPAAATFELKCIGKFPRMRALYWDGDVLYASSGYELLRGTIESRTVTWQIVGHYRPEWWRKISSVSQLSFSLFRDGFHALARLPTNHVIAAVPKAIVTLVPGELEFYVSHRILRGTRPLHISSTPDGRV